MTFHSLSPWTTDVQTSYGFEPAFFDRTQAQEAISPVVTTGSGPTNAPERPPGYDEPMLANDFRKLNGEFLKSTDAERARSEWTVAFETILDFARAHRLQKAQDQLVALRDFRRDNLGPAVGGEIELYRPDYKPWMEAVAQHLGNDRISLEVRCEALQRIDGLGACPARHRDEFRQAALWLKGMGGGLGESVWCKFSALALGQLTELLRAEPQLAGHDFTTPHALTPFAAALRLPGFSRASERQDAYVLDIRLYGEVIRRCAARLEERLTMTLVAERLAEECLRDVHRTLSAKVSGVAIDLCDGTAHWTRLQETMEKLPARYGDLQLLDVVDLDEDGLPRSLTDDTRLLTLRIRGNMTRLQIAPAPRETFLERQGVAGDSRCFMLFEDKWPYVVEGGSGKDSTPRRRLPTAAEIDGLLRPAPGPHSPSTRRFDETTRRVLTAYADALRTKDLDPAAATRERVAANPTVEGLRIVIERQGLDDRALTAWLDDAAPRWDAAALDDALQLLIGSRRAAPLAALLAAWRVEGFADSWQRCVRDQAVRDRALNTDARIQGRDADGDLPDGGRRPPQQQMLARIEQQLGAVAPLAATRVCLQAFRERHPPGSDRKEAFGFSLHETLDALRRVRAGPARLLTVPLLAEDGGLSEALESTFFAHNAERLQDELDLIFNVAIGLELSPEETATLLQVTSRDRIPVPSPFGSAALLSGRLFLVDCLFDWVTKMFRRGLLDPSAAKRVLLPDALEAAQAVPRVPNGKVFQALQRYLERLDTARDLGLLKSSDLVVAAGTSSDTPGALLRSAAERGGAVAAALLEKWRSKHR
ncbi:hypothetical protein PV762_00410 [Mitsuaria sp. CC2]|uniref:hypothetical protein n=1 Tax=Mitsuaria sp. CC2 TaxID=3029186 RepID=UPI003B8BBBBE